jgi:hypothetical protein
MPLLYGWSTAVKEHWRPPASRDDTTSLCVIWPSVHSTRGTHHHVLWTRGSKGAFTLPFRTASPFSGSRTTAPFLGRTSPGVPENHSEHSEHSEHGTNNEHATARRRRLTATIAERQHGLAQLPVADNSDRLPGLNFSSGIVQCNCNPGPGTIPIRSRRRNPIKLHPCEPSFVCVSRAACAIGPLYLRCELPYFSGSRRRMLCSSWATHLGPSPKDETSSEPHNPAVAESRSLAAGSTPAPSRPPSAIPPEASSPPVSGTHISPKHPSQASRERMPATYGVQNTICTRETTSYRGLCADHVASTAGAVFVPLKEASCCFVAFFASVSTSALYTF